MALSPLSFDLERRVLNRYACRELLLVVPGSLAGVGPMELLLIAVVAVIVLGPDVMRKS